MPKPLKMITLLLSFSAIASYGTEAESAPEKSEFTAIPAMRGVLIQSDISAAGKAESGWGLAAYVARATSSQADAVAVGDVTGDGRNDVVLTTSFFFDEANDYHLFLFRQQANGQLAAPIKVPYGYVTSRSSVAIIDFDQIAGKEVVVGEGGGLSVFSYSTAAGFRKLKFGSTHNVDVIMPVDLTGNGREDLATVSWDRGGFIHLNAGDGNLRASPWQARVQGYNKMARGDLNGDGRADIAIASGQGVAPYITLYRNDHRGALTEWQHLASICPDGISGSIGGIGIGDIDNDGHADVIAASGGNQPGVCLQVFRGSASGIYGAPIYYPSADIPGALRVVDIDRDGRLDLVIMHSGAVGVYRQEQDGTLSQVRLFPLPSSSPWAHAIEVADINGDRCPDVVIAGSREGLITLQGQQCVRFFDDGFE